MKRQLWIIPVLIALSSSPADASLAKDFLSRDLKFRQDGKIIMGNPLPGQTINSMEEGVYNWVHYKIYHGDGSGTFGTFEESDLNRYFRESATSSEISRPVKKELIGWETFCKQDAMDDSRYCFASRDDLTISLTVSKASWLSISWSDTTQLRIWIKGRAAPGSSVAIRFGSERPIVTSERGWSGEPAKKLFARLVATDKVVTRYHGLDGIEVDKETRTFGISEAFEYLKFAVGQKRPK